MAIMLITQLLTPTVFNWDSNWYNLSRIPAMIIEHSVFPENTGSLWHLLHSLSHDLLFLLDIAVGSLRGMGLIATLEYFVILGCLYQLVLSMLSDSDSGKAGIEHQCSLLLVTVLFASSDLQVLQSADPKNDLIIVVTFMISLSLSINSSLRREAPLQYLLAILLVAIYSLSAKGYGMIVFIPPLIVFTVDSLGSASSIRMILSNAYIYFRGLLRDGSKLLYQNRVLLLFVTINALFITFTYIKQIQSVLNSTHSSELAEMASKLSNVNGSLSDRLVNFGLNTIRNSVSFLLYPYSTLRKLNAIRPDDYVFGFGPFKQLMDDPRGMINGTSVVRDIKADAAHGSIFMVPLIIIIFCLLSRRLMRSGLSLKFASTQLRGGLYNRYQLIHTSLIIFLSCFLTLLFFSYSLLNTTFVSKYMGPTYVPLIPVISVILAQFIDFKLKYVMHVILIASLYAILRLGILLNFSMIPSFLNQLINAPSSLSVQQSPNLFYYQYAGFRYDPEEASQWLSSLSSLSSDQLHVFCFGSETPSLTPLMHAIQSFNQNKNVDLRLSSTDQCKRSSDHSGGNFNTDKQKAKYIYLP
jgi:hypothetical protein